MIKRRNPGEPGLAFRALQQLLRVFFRTFYLLEVRGLEQIPEEGPVMVAGNHVNPFDAIIIGACMPRRTRFVVWNRTFAKPVVGRLLRWTGCIPLNRDRPDLAAFKECLRWLDGGGILGIFPEGRYTETGHLHELKPGAMRIALAARAAVVPASLTGAYRAWPLRGANAQVFPRPWKIELHFHPPLAETRDPGSEIREQRLQADNLTQKLAAAINSTLEPSIRAEQRVDHLIERPAPHLRIYEWFLPLVLLATRDLRAGILAAAYFLYLLADVYWIKQSVLTRALRNFAPVIVLALAYPTLRALLGPAPGGAWLVVYAVGLAYLLWVLVRYCFRRYYQFQRFVRGLLVTLYLGLLQMILRPDTPRANLAVLLCLYALAFDFTRERRRFLMVVGPVLAVLTYAGWQTGYPPSAWLWNALTVFLVYAYLHFFRFRAHDGRRI